MCSLVAAVSPYGNPIVTCLSYTVRKRQIDQLEHLIVVT